MELTEKDFEHEVFNRLIITSTRIGLSSSTVKKQILSNQEIVKRLKEELKVFQKTYKKLGGDDWKGTKPKVFEIFQSILGDKKWN